MADTYTTEMANFKRNRKNTFPLKRCDIELSFPGDMDNFVPLLHVDDITPSYNSSTQKTRGQSSNNIKGLNYSENDDATTYTITVVGLNDKIRYLLNRAHDFQLDVGFRVRDRLTGAGFTFRYCAVNNRIGRGTMGIGRDSLIYTIVLSTYEKDDEYDFDNEDFDEKEKEADYPSSVFPGVNDELGI